MSALLDRIGRGVAEGRLRPLELALADWCLRQGGSEPVAVALTLTTRALFEGHSCLVLDDGAPALPGERPICDPDAFRQALEASALVGGAGASRPLILDGGRLYLHRYWEYEARLAKRLRQLMARPPVDVDLSPLTPNGGLFDYGWIGTGETHWQAVAAATAMRQRFTVISGGPGTGKTYTVLRLMRLLVAAAAAAGQSTPAIRLAAPTGKAAARMTEAIRAGVAGMPDGQVLREMLPDKASTLHRLLGLRRQGTRPWHDREHPLVADAVIVDEASMVDLPLMAKLADAIPDHARLVLLGDRYQLASVESGSVLGELCDAAGINAFSEEQRRILKPLLAADAPPTPTDPVPLADHVVTLQTSHRFRRDSAIGRIAAAVNAGHLQAVLDEGQAPGDEVTVTLTDEVAGPAVDRLVGAVCDAYGPLFEAPDPAAALTVLESVRLLTATRVGPMGSETLNRRIHHRLAERHDFDPWKRWFHARPVIVLHNDYRLGLYNGDTGICLRGTDGSMRVWFPGENGARQFLPGALPEHETAYAMTIHKGQGSEFDVVHLLLAQAGAPVLNRELLYTGITRARRQVHLVASAAALQQTIDNRTRRDSGLAPRLAEPHHDPA